MELTQEQQAAVELFKTGKSIAIQAGAGTGKTSTLLAMASSTQERGTYIAFNKAIVEEAKKKFPANVTCRTVHSLAFGAVGKLFKHRLNAGRIRTESIAKILGVQPLYYTYNGEQRVMQPARLAGLAIQGIRIFCNSADKTPGAQHIPYVDGIDMPGDKGRGWENNNRIRKHLEEVIAKAWADLSSQSGQLPFSHDVYVKLWELGAYGPPVIPGKFVFVDEAQDLSGVMISILEQQKDKQVILVGDAQQAIYGWRGAIDAMENVPAEQTCFLTHSFRFGPEIADVANKILGTIPKAKIRMIGRAKAGTIGAKENNDVVLCRTNAGAIQVVLQESAIGRKVHLVGGGGEVERFCKAAKQLKDTGHTDHPDLACFQSWGEVQDYCEFDELGTDLKLMVDLIDSYGVEAILRAVDGSVRMDQADLIVSTAHKAKGLEWPSVKIHHDFTENRMANGNDEEKRLMYVAATRAQSHLDHSSCSWLLDLLRPKESIDA